MPSKWFSKNSSLESKMKLDPDLARVRDAFVAADNLHKKLHNVIHVAGTNGKGSTIAFIKSILRSAGFSVNATTSPHLIRINERIDLNGRNITDQEMESIESRYGPVMDKYGLSFFERATMVAFAAFVENPADFDIVEVGLGGTLDATNVIDSKKICVITSIGLDHCDILGDTVEEIAKNKLGIVRDGDDVVIGYQDHNIGYSGGYAGGRDWFINKNFKLGLEGDHQYYNAGNAVAVCDVLRRAGFAISNEAIEDGLRKAKWPARLQRVDNFLIDGAHNPQAVDVLCDYLRAMEGKKVGIMAVMGNKDVSGICTPLHDLFDVVCCVPIEGAFAQRAMPPKDLCDMLVANGINAFSVDSVAEAIGLDVIKNAKTTVVFGSLFLAGEVLFLLGGDSLVAM